MDARPFPVPGRRLVLGAAHEACWGLSCLSALDAPDSWRTSLAPPLPKPGRAMQFSFAGGVPLAAAEKRDPGAWPGCKPLSLSRHAPAQGGKAGSLRSGRIVVQT